MTHVRLFKHYVHAPLIAWGAAEFAVLIGSAYAGHFWRFGEWQSTPLSLLTNAVIYAAAIIVAMLAMGVYRSQLREGYAGMLLRTAVSFFLLGATGLAILYYALPTVAFGRGELAASLTIGFVAIQLLRLLLGSLISEEALKSRILVLGTGTQALRIALRMRRRSDQRAFRIVGFAPVNGSSEDLDGTGATIIQRDMPLVDICTQHKINEIVVAVDDRRRSSDGANRSFPMEELLECKLSGVQVTDILGFFEREAGRIEIDLLNPSYMVFSDGFKQGVLRNWSERAFDLFASLFLLAIAWPAMVLVALAVKLDGRWSDPVFYRQTRVGLGGKHFDVIKFRSMVTDAEVTGEAQWAQQNDSRVTTVGNIIRRARLDELPQLINVLNGEMSFVGPRPERPVFVDKLSETIPYYSERHRVKPGITGWAQLCYPYGASERDAARKLEYDLYYMKNHSILLDLLILIQTVEVVMVGDGAR